MGAFIPDGKADFITDGKQDLDLKQFLMQNDRNVEVIKIDDLKLEDANHFREILIKEDIHNLMISGAAEKQREIIDAALNAFTDDDDKLIVTGNNAISLDEFIDKFNERIKFSYAGSDKEIQKRVEAAKDKQDASMNRIKSRFEKVLKRFTQGQDINQMVDNVLQKGTIYFLDIETYEDELNRFILGVIYKRFRRRTSYFFRQKKYSNAIVYVDEANRFIPQSTNDDKLKSLAMDLIDGIKTTRQYGLAWWFADQRPAAISKDAFTQLGTYFFGEGMIAAADKDNMEAVIGKEGLQIYDYVMSTSRKLFVATGQFVGIGNNDAVTVPINFFGSWAEMAESNNQDFDAHLKK
jgi:DNA helicase HerA-like ATPase